MTVSKFCDREGVSVTAFHYWRRRLGLQQPEQVSRLAAPVFQAVELLSQRAVVIRFAAGGVMEIPEDRVDLVRRDPQARLPEGAGVWRRRSAAAGGPGRGQQV